MRTEGSVAIAHPPLLLVDNPDMTTNHGDLTNLVHVETDCEAAPELHVLPGDLPWQTPALRRANQDLFQGYSVQEEKKRCKAHSQLIQVHKSRHHTGQGGTLPRGEGPHSAELPPYGFQVPNHGRKTGIVTILLGMLFLTSRLIYVSAPLELTFAVFVFGLNPTYVHPVFFVLSVMVVVEGLFFFTSICAPILGLLAIVLMVDLCKRAKERDHPDENDKKNTGLMTSERLRVLLMSQGCRKASPVQSSPNANVN